jgi:hypothetical protein
MVSSKESRQSPRSSTQMFPLILEWEQSNLSQKEFCISRGIKSHIFWYWLRRYRERSQSEKKSVKGFIPVEVKQGGDPVVLAEIIYGDGIRVVFKERVGLKLLQGLLPKV